MKIYAVIPARSGSKGVPNKNIRILAGNPLIHYSIEFARKLPFVDRIFCSTDSQDYADIAINHGAEVPFLRSKHASTDTAMEQDILLDLRNNFIKFDIPEPDLILWLRPTFVIRSVSDVTKCAELLINNSEYSSARTVVRAENRLYSLENNDILKPSFNDLGRSMMRRQDMIPSFKVFSTDIFRFKGNDFSLNFLGDRVAGVETHQICGLDIDNEIDFEIIKCLIENMGEKLYEYLS